MGRRSLVACNAGVVPVIMSPWSLLWSPSGAPWGDPLVPLWNRVVCGPLEQLGAAHPLVPLWDRVVCGPLKQLQ
jgi:hypothetical protein